MTHHLDGRDGLLGTRPATRSGGRAPVLAAMAVLAAGAVLVAGAVRPVTARFSGSTDSRGSLMRTAVVELELAGGDTTAVDALAIDASNLVPGDVVQRCVAVTYRGSADEVDVRVHGRSDGGSGLEAYLASRIEVGAGSDPTCGDFVPASTVFDDTLAALWSDHGSFERGVALVSDGADGAATTLRVTLRLLDDDAAQGRDTGFWIVLEARP